VKSPKLDTLAKELSLNEIKNLLRRKQKEALRLEKLQAKRKGLLAQIEELGAEIEKLKGGPGTGKLKAAKKPRRKGRRPARKGKTVREYAVEYMSSGDGKARLGDIVSYVVSQRKGETKPTPTDWAGVSMVLRNEKSIRRVRKGLYRYVGEKAPESKAQSKPGKKEEKKDAKKTVKQTGKGTGRPRATRKPKATSGSVVK
jgi:hypothetical protein